MKLSFLVSHNSDRPRSPGLLYGSIVREDGILRPLCFDSADAAVQALLSGMKYDSSVASPARHIWREISLANLLVVLLQVRR